MSLSLKEVVQRLKFQVSSPTQESQINVECPPLEGREQHYGYHITQDFILAFENEIKKFVDPDDFYDPMCVSLTRNWLLKELHLHQLDYKCCVDSVLVPEDSGDEDSEGEVEGEVEGIADEREDGTKSNEQEGDPIGHDDTKDDDTQTDEQESSHYGDEEGDPDHYEDEKYDEEGDTIHYEDEKVDDTKTDEEESTHYEDEKEDNPRTEDQGDASPYEDEKDAKEDQDEGYTSHDDEDESSVFGDADDEFEVEYDAEEVVVVISVCSNDPVSFQVRPSQAQMDMMTALLSQQPQWWVSYRDI